MGKTAKLLRILLEIALVLALAFVLLRDYRAQRQETEAETVTISWVLPNAETRKQFVLRGTEITLPKGDALEGYTFLYWQDSRGNPETRQRFAVYEDCSYAAVYAMALNTQQHFPYLSMEDGLFHPSRLLSRREAAVMLYRLLDTQLVGSGVFSDVPETDDCYAAAATLKTLGLVEGSRFHPDEAITRAELLQMLAALYPSPESSCDFDDLLPTDSCYRAFCLAAEQGWIAPGGKADPNGTLTRAETARLMNRVLGRSERIDDPPGMVGTILDVSFSDAYFNDIAEAAVSHNYDGEQWTGSAPLPVQKSGFFLMDSRLHYIDESGSPLVNASLGSIAFNADGEVTSGLPELDELLVQVLQEQQETPRLQDLLTLEKLFNYTVNSFSYLGRSHYEAGETGWEAQEAYTMLTTGKGNCYNFAAVFCELARFIGYDAQVYSGYVKGPGALDENGDVLWVAERPHAWVEIVIKGEARLFDPELAHSYLGQSDANFFNRGQGVRRQFNYHV